MFIGGMLDSPTHSALHETIPAVYDHDPAGYGFWPGRKVYTAVTFKNYFISHVAKNKIMTDGS